MDDLISRSAVLWITAETGALETQRRVRELPAIDAVPVVRCGDCKKRQDHRECPMCFTEVEDIAGGRMYKFTDLTRPDGFCHKGAKIDGGASGA